MKFQMVRISLVIVLSSLALITVSAQECVSKNTAFKAGEEVTYIVSYDWFIIWSDVGEVKTYITDTIYNGNPAYKYKAYGSTYKSWDWVFKVRDVFQTVVDKRTLKPYESSRNIKEGRYRQVEKHLFNFEDTVVYAYNSTNDKPQTLDTIPINGCSFDILSSLLFARNIDFTNHKEGDIVPITILLDKDKYDIYFRYLGIEDYKLKGAGTFECIKFSVMLIEGEMFHEGENMTVWATNDKNRIVVYAESPILVGSVKLKLKKVRGNRYPVSSFEKLKD